MSYKGTYIIHTGVRRFQLNFVRWKNSGIQYYQFNIILIICTFKISIRYLRIEFLISLEYGRLKFVIYYNFCFNILFINLENMENYILKNVLAFR